MLIVETIAKVRRLFRTEHKSIREPPARELIEGDVGKERSTLMRHR